MFQQFLREQRRGGSIPLSCLTTGDNQSQRRPSAPAEIDDRRGGERNGRLEYRQVVVGRAGRLMQVEQQRHIAAASLLELANGQFAELRTRPPMNPAAAIAVAPFAQSIEIALVPAAPMPRALL